MEIILSRSDDNHHKYEVFGTSGNQYDIQIHDNILPSCTCPDYRYRSKMCKHIKFITKKHLMMNTFYLKDGLSDHHVKPTEEPKMTFRNGECGVCLENIYSEQPTAFCCTCQNATHYQCFHATKRAICVYCRSDVIIRI